MIIPSKIINFAQIITFTLPGSAKPSSKLKMSLNRPFYDKCLNSGER